MRLCRSLANSRVRLLTAAFDVLRAFRPVRFGAACVVGASVALTPAARATTYTYNGTTPNTAATADSWAGGVNWNAVPVSGNTTTLQFGTGASTSLNPGDTIFTNNDIPGNFLLNSLNFRYNGDPTATVTILGNPLEFQTTGSTTPTLILAPSTGTAQPLLTVNNALVLDNQVAVSGLGSAVLTGNVSGAAGLTLNGTGVVTLSGSNSYGTLPTSGNTVTTTGNTAITGAGTLRAIANAGNTNGGVSSALSANSYITVSAAAAAPAVLDLRADASTTFNSAGLTVYSATSNGGGSRAVTINVDRPTGGTGTNGVITLGGNVAIPNLSSGLPSIFNITGANGYSLALNTVTDGSPGVIFNMTTANVSIATLASAFGNTAIINGAGGNTTGGTFTFYGSGNATVAGETIGPSSRGRTLNIGGTATGQTLTGSVTLTGGTSGGNNFTFNVNSGTLNVNSAAALGAGAVPRQLNISGGALDNTTATAITVSTTGGSNLLTTQINADFGYGGTKALNLGTGLVNLGTSGAVTRTITANGTTEALTIGGNIANNTNGITKAGTGTLILSGIGFQTGTTTVSNGTLVVNGANFAAPVAQNGTNTAASNAITGLTNTALLRLGEGVSGTNIPTGSYITSITSGTAITISQSITTANSANSLAFSAGSATGTGAVQVNAGTLGGTGTISGAVTTAGTTSVIAPGPVGAVGILTMASTLDTSAGASFNYTLNGTTTASHVAVTGALTLNTNSGGEVFNFSGTGITTGTPYQLITFGSVNSTTITSGEFTAATVPAGYQLDPTYGTGGFAFNGSELDVQFVTAVPEPSTVIGGLLLVGCLGYRLRRRSVRTA